MNGQPNEQATRASGGAEGPTEHLLASRLAIPLYLGDATAQRQPRRELSACPQLTQVMLRPRSHCYSAVVSRPSTVVSTQDRTVMPLLPKAHWSWQRIKTLPTDDSRRQSPRRLAIRTPASSLIRTSSSGFNNTFIFLTWSLLHSIYTSHWKRPPNIDHD